MVLHITSTFENASMHANVSPIIVDLKCPTCISFFAILGDEKSITTPKYIVLIVHSIKKVVEKNRCMKYPKDTAKYHREEVGTFLSCIT